MKRFYMVFKKFDRSDKFNLLGLIIGVAAAVFFYLGSKTMPWDLQTWGGNSVQEAAFRNGRSSDARMGFMLLALNFSFQAAAIIAKKNT